MKELQHQKGDETSYLVLAFIQLTLCSAVILAAGQIVSAKTLPVLGNPQYFLRQPSPLLDTLVQSSLY